MKTVAGMVALDGANNVTGADGDVGDSMFHSGIAASVGMDLPGVPNCVASDGRPFRHPSYVYVDEKDTFSRDQLLGLLHWCVANKNRVLLPLVLNRYKATKDMCEGSGTDGKGKIRLSTWLLVGASCRYLGISTPWLYFLMYPLMGMIFLVEALTVPSGYQQHLVSQALWLLDKTGHTGALLRWASNILYWRTPTNLWFKALYAALSGDRKLLIFTEFEVEQLAAKIGINSGTSGLYWLWESRMELKHLKSPCGWDFEFIRKFIHLRLE